MAALGLALCMALAAPPAGAATGHRFLGSLSEAPAGTTIVEPVAVAVQHSSGRVFVADAGRGVIDLFSSSGTFEGQFGGGALVGVAGVAVDEGTGDVYVADAFRDTVDVFKPDGKGGYGLLSQWSGASLPAEAFGELAGVAVDNSTSASDPHAGNLYVVDASGDAVDAFKPRPAGIEEAKEGSFVGALSGGKLEEPNGVAVDSATGQVYVADGVGGVLDVFASSGSFEKKLTGAGSPEGTFSGSEEEQGNVAAVSVDEATGEIYVAEAQRRVLSQFNSEGKWIGWTINTPAGALGEPSGVAVGAGGDVYLVDAGAHLVDVLGPDVVVPDAKTDAALKIAKTGAILNGAVNGDGKIAGYRFQWGEGDSLAHETDTQSAGVGEEKALAELSALKADTTYSFRLVVENENGANYGAIRKFTTAPAVEDLGTGAAENVTPSQATLTGTLKPAGVDTHFFFEWGKTPAYGSRSPEPPADAGAGKEAVEVKATLTGLEANTTYHYRLVGQDELGASVGEDARFTTLGPPRVASEATSVEGHEAATLHARIEPGKLETKYHFEYGETTAYGSEAPLGGATISVGEAAVSVSAALTTLKLGTTYHFRVVAVNAAGAVTGSDQTFTTVPSAPVQGLSTAEVSATEATLQAQIDPLGRDTTYSFQYGTESCSEQPGSCASMPNPPVEIGAGETPVSESQRLQGLSPSTTYHYRVIASNSLGTTQSEEHSFTTQQAEKPFVLPDNRAWEMVSPPDKHGAPIEALTREGGLILAAEDGNSLSYLADGSIEAQPQGNRSPEMQQVLARRTSEGWRSQDIATANTAAQGYSLGAPQEYQFFTPDLMTALVEPYGASPLSEPPLAPEATQKTIYLRNDQTGSYLPLVTEANVPPATTFGKRINFVSATPDLNHVVLHSEVPLTEPPSAGGLYEWSAGKLTLVSLLPQGTPAPTAQLGFAGNVVAHAISSDGNRVIWTSQNNLPGHLYMRDIPAGTTVQLDAAQGVSEPPGAARFQTASADGSKVFFTDTQRLTPDSTAEPTPGEPANGRADLYECEITEVEGRPACHLKDLTVPEYQGEHASVQGLVLGAGEDGSSVYLVAQAVLSENENGNGETAQTGEDNLYALHAEGEHWTMTFIATLSSEDTPEWEGKNRSGDTAFVTTRVSPNGRYFAFMSAASLTGYDNLDQLSGKRDEEVYLYDSATASLACASCNPSGARPAGVLDTVEAGEGRGLLVDRRKVWSENSDHWLAGNLPGWTAQSLANALFQPRYLSNEGRLFFNSPDHLVAAATNGKENVYEYEPSSVGTCQSSSGACVSLLSAGSSARESAFLEATPSGNDVFFLTAAQLLPQDADTAFDVYDARVCTTESRCLAPQQTASGGCEAAETCREAAPAHASPVGPSGTATFTGPGNTTSPPNVAQPRHTTTKPKPLTRAQKLARALKACSRLNGKNKRQACVRKARKAYATKHAPSNARRSRSGHRR